MKKKFQMKSKIECVLFAPPEILCKILDYCSMQDILNLQEVNCEIVENSGILWNKYKSYKNINLKIDELLKSVREERQTMIEIQKLKSKESKFLPYPGKDIQERILKKSWDNIAESINLWLDYHDEDKSEFVTMKTYFDLDQKSFDNWLNDMENMVEEILIVDRKFYKTDVDEHDIFINIITIFLSYNEPKTLELKNSPKKLL